MAQDASEAEEAKGRSGIITRYDGGGQWSPGHDYAGKWLWRVVGFALVIFLGHVVLAHVGFIGAWADALPRTVNLPDFGGTLPVGDVLRLWQHPGAFYAQWIGNILAKVPQ